MSDKTSPLVSTQAQIPALQGEASVMTLVPQAVGKAIEEVLFTNPEYFDLDERDLYKRLRSEERVPSPTDNRLRLKFWDEYDRAQASGHKQMNMVNVVSGVCTREYFYGTYIRNPQKMAWLLCPPTSYLVKAEEALEFGLEQLRDILAQDHGQGLGTNTKLGELKAKIVAMLDTRVRGAVVQKTMSVNVHTSNSAVAKAATASTMEDLQKQLKELERKNRLAQNLPLEIQGKPDIEVTPGKVEREKPRGR